MKGMAFKSNRFFSAVILAGFLLCGIQVWGGEAVLFHTDFSSSDWSGVTSICNSSNAENETYNGITFHSYNSSAKPFTVDQSAGTMTWCNNNMGNNFWIAIPVTGVNGSLTITVSNGTSNTRFNYVRKAETSISGSPGSGTSSTGAAPSVVTISSLTESDYVVYLGRQGSGVTKVKSITITTPCAAPTSVTVSGNWHIFPGDEISLTATATGGAGTYAYQWYKGGTDEANKIAGATSAVYTKDDVTFDDAGAYYCKVSTGSDCETVSGVFNVKMLRLYVNVGRAGTDYGYVDLTNTDPANSKASGMIFLGEDYDYAFSIADGCGHYYGQNNDKVSGAMNYSNCTGWDMNSDQQCWIRTRNGATYTFIVDYSNITVPKVSVEYPLSDQAAGKVIYFDNSVLNWATPYYRIGKTDYTDATLINKVPGTENLYQYTTTAWNGLSAWQIADNSGDNGSGQSIYKTNTGSANAINNSINYEGGAVTQPVITITPGASHSTGGAAQNSNCEFYSYTMMPGIKTQHVAIDAPTGGTITVSYTDIDNTAQSFNNGERDLAHTCILTITATANPGYELGTLTVNGVDFTSGETYVLSADATIAATFTEKNYSVTLNTNGGTIQSGDVTSYAYGTGATLPTDIKRDGMLFEGWYDNASLTGPAITEISTTDSGDKEFWAKWRVKPAMFQYILGSCYVKNGVWTQGNDGSVGAWRYKTEDGNLLATSDISFSAGSASIYYNTKDLTQLDDPSKWNNSSSSNKAIKALKVGKDATLSFDLGSMTAYKIVFYVFPGSDDAYSIDLTVNGVTENKPIAAGQQNKWHKYEYDGSTYTGPFSITSNSKETRVVVIVEVPAVKISFDANDGSGTMNPMLVSEGDEVQLPENDFTRSGYRFLGWREDAGGTGALIDDEGLYSTSADVTLYAQWIEIVHTTITLDATGAYNSYTTSVVASSGEPMPEITALPQRVGHVFNGYFSEPNGGGTQYYTGLGVGTQTWNQTASAVTLYAHWLEPCDLVPTLAKMAPVVTIWDKQAVDMGVARLLCDFDTTGVSYELVSPPTPIAGCHFEYFDEQIHLMGMPNRGNSTTETVNVTLTMANNCSPSTSFDITITIRIYPENQKPKIAFILTGTEKASIAAGGNFSAYNTSDSTACKDLLAYLKGFYDVTCVNGYATKDEAEIAEYYKQYDLLVVTDFLNTGKGYTNKLGTLIDKKPILSFEAYVANQSNWHIGSNPKDPSPKVKTMKILCAGHAIFKDAEGVDVYNETDTTVQVLSTLSTADKAKGLQGFTINEAPDFIFLATIRDEANSRDLVVCCERQIVFSARLLIYGINFYEMGGLSPAGRVVMHQMIDYLLMTDETKIADCSLVFDNHNGTGVWSDPENWAPGYNIVPTPYHPTRIAAVCNVDIDYAHAGSVKINQGRSGNPDGKLIIKPYGGLTVAGIVTKVNDTRYASPTTIKPGDLLIEADATHNGAFVYGNKESDVSARVEYYSRGEGAPNNPVWQYIGIPTRAGKTAISMFYEAWMCRWTTAGTMGGLWQWVTNEEVLQPFEGYAITQAAQKKYTLEGKLNLPVTRTLDLNRRDDEGYAFAANSWTAPIKIQEFQDADFTNAEKTIYIYHSGTYANWYTNKETIINADLSGATPNPGQYAVIPIHSAPYLGADSVIPAMQGFFVKTTAADAKLKLVYNRVVYDATYFKTSTQPMRAPRRAAAASDGPEVMKLNISGDTYGDRIYLLSQNGFTESYEDGWDGRKIDGDINAPRLAVIKEAGEMAVAAVESFDERNLSFRAGSDSEYTFSFEYEGETIYLYDRVTGVATEIRTGNTYSFTATNATPENRFLITTNPPQIMTDVNNVQRDDERSTKAQKFIRGGRLHIFHRGVVYDAQGARVQYRKEGAK